MLDLLAYSRTNFPATNLFKNGSGSTTNGWAAFNSNIRSENGELILTSNDNYRSPFLLQKPSNIDENDIVYARGVITPLVSGADIRIQVTSTAQKFVEKKQDEIEKMTDYTLSGTAKKESANFDIAYRISGDIPANADVLSVKNALSINLTKTFGEGNEPTTEQMDNLLSQFESSWFDGTQNIFNAEHFMKMYFNKMQELENAITSLGGNI